MSSPHPREVDPVTGHDTTGHDWNGIKELNTPFPKLVIWALVLTFLYSVIAWILLPAWPTGRDYTRGLLGLDQGAEAVAGFHEIATERQGWLDRFAADDFAAQQSDAPLMKVALPAAQRLFADNCAACHGLKGQGGPGFPVLADDTWLWSGAPDEIAVTISHGINSDDPDARFSEMPAFDGLPEGDRAALATFVSDLHGGGGTADWNSPAAALFAENCSSCHGEHAEGGLGNGAPSLTDAAVIYGQDPQTVALTLRHGRHGVMPAWTGRLSKAEINLLALYVAGLRDAVGPRAGAAP